MNREPNPDNCPECNKRRKHNFVWCTCGNKLWDSKVIHFTGDSHTAGFAGYNEGLGVNIKNKGHWEKVVKEKGATPLG